MARTPNTNTSGIVGYVHTKTSMTIKYASGSTYRYDLSRAFKADQLNEMIKLAEAGAGLNSYLNANPDIKKYGYIDETLRNQSFHKYG